MTPTEAKKSDEQPAPKPTLGWAIQFVLGSAGAGILWGVLGWSLTFGSDVDWSRAIPKGIWADLSLSLNLTLILAGILFGLFAALSLKKERTSDRMMRERRALIFLLASGLAVLFLRFSLGSQTTPIWVFVSLLVALCVALLNPRERSTKRWALVIERWGLVALGMIAAAVYLTFSLTRHHNFGSGSWDLGCYNHNIWLMGHAKPLVSTVLGEVNFIGDHFVPILFLFAPLSWFDWTGALLFVQAIAIAAVVWPIRQLAIARGLGMWTQLSIGIAFLFSVGTQSMINFDFHEIVLVPLGLMMALWALASRRRHIFLLFTCIVFLSKESAILYAGALGLYALFFSDNSRRLGLGVALFCGGSFLLVVGWLQPMLLDGGPQGMIHLARFSTFGDSMSEALINMMLNPGKVLAYFFTPEKKLSTLLITFGGFGFLPFLVPEAWLLMMPNLMVRFLSDKTEMWGLGFHYSIVLVTLCAYATLVGIERANRIIDRGSEVIRPGFVYSGNQKDALWGVFILMCTVGTWWLSPLKPEFSSLQKPYFSEPELVEVNYRALDMIPDDARVVAQNHFLPFLAYRQYIWQPQDKFFAKANYAILNPSESPWPHSKRHIVKWMKRLSKDPEWTLIFSEKTTVVFSKESKSEVEVDPAIERLIR
jgi:uncharacterized membrane protein